ncbi:LysR family transcriptional regulator [Brucella pseudogrignonensis]|uniref:LysR family transcriptional regulator n=1 Tax=Brucella pseudogrignonensis TaxID=419475 RepID=UPI0007DA52E0|nr:LysR family transcriptional regulator [Brucella pseudogrignonensis]ANG98610.1 LysR family transcriptional regulator [Brucella pseudogrignonensis]
MQHRSMVYFREVAQTGSLHEASSRLHISTSAISRQIAKLEESLGIVLFERRPRGMVLTAAGELLLQRTQRLAIGMEEALSELRALAGKSHGLIRIASYEGFALDCLTPAIEAFREQHPAVHFHVWVGTSPDICARIKNGSADIGITYSYPPPPDIAIQHIALRPIFAALRSDHPLAGRRSVTLDDLRGEQWAVPDEDRTQRLLLQAALAAKGITFNPVFSTNSMAMLRAYSFSSGTTSITGSPDLVRGNDFDIALVPIEDPILATSALHILTMEGRNLSPTMIRFVDALKALTPPVQN